MDSNNQTLSPAPASPAHSLQPPAQLLLPSCTNILDPSVDEEVADFPLVAHRATTSLGKTSTPS